MNFAPAVKMWSCCKLPPDSCHRGDIAQRSNVASGRHSASLRRFAPWHCGHKGRIRHLMQSDESPL